MKPMDLGEFQAALAECFATYGKTLGANQIEAIFKALEPFSLHQVRRAMTLATQRCKFPPSVAHLVDIIRDTAPQAHSGPMAGRAQCSFVNNGQRCPLVGHYPRDPQDLASPRECEEHHFAIDGDHAARILNDLMANRSEITPPWQDAKVAQDLLRSMTQERVAAQFSWSVVRFVQQHTAEFPDIRDFYRANRNRQMKPEKPHQGPFAGPCDTRIGDAIDAAGF